MKRLREEFLRKEAELIKIRDNLKNKFDAILKEKEDKINGIIESERKK